MGRDLQPVLALVAVQYLVGVYTQITEWIDRHQHVSNICVNVAIFETLLEVVVDGLVGDFADQREIGDAHFLLLGRFEHGLLGELRRGLSFAGRGVLLAPCALGDGHG